MGFQLIAYFDVCTLLSKLTLFLMQKVGSDHLALVSEFAFTPRTKEGNNFNSQV